MPEEVNGLLVKVLLAVGGFILGVLTSRWILMGIRYLLNLVIGKVEAKIAAKKAKEE